MEKRSSSSKRKINPSLRKSPSGKTSEKKGGEVGLIGDPTSAIDGCRSRKKKKGFGETR